MTAVTPDVSSDRTPDEATLIAEARQHVGTPATQRRVGRDPVNLAMIHHWVDALDDRNLAYTDDATATRHGGVIAPPALLGSWTMDPARPAPEAVRAGDTAPAAHGDGGIGSERDQVLRRLDMLGYTAVVATNYEQEYVRALRPGDRIVEEMSVEELSERKDTALGTGYFVTVRHDYFDADGQLVGIARMRLLKFKPKARPDGSEAQPAARRPRPPINRDNAFFWDGVGRGELLIQRCASCGRLRHPPRPMCGRCRSTEWDTVQSTGDGTVYSYAVHHHPPLPGIRLPLIVVLVELDEGVRIISNLVGTEADAVAIGQRVRLDIRRVDGDLTLPLFVPAEAS